MTKRGDRGSPTSVRARLLEQARASKADYNQLLIRYANERFLYRLASSPHGNQFVLKGGTLFAVWADVPYRPTKDLDLHGYGDSDPDKLAVVFQEIAEYDVERDGLNFDSATIEIDPIRVENVYDAHRITVTGSLGTARVKVQIDVAFGDATAVPPIEVTMPTLLDGQPAPTLRAYRPELVVAEKFHAIVHLGMVNTRMKDYYDLYVLADFDLDREALEIAIRGTFEQRRTPVPETIPDGLSDAFVNDATKIVQWKAFLRRSSLPTLELNEVGRKIRELLL